ncbi:MAG: 16S rRNA (guanine(966)-N(2))-methyltransferase RsmD [Candidatus Kapaibacteriota bacterium]
MRIIGGSFKGKSFKFKIPKQIRPTSDFAREAIFDTLQNIISLDRINVLDLFAGTGMLGIEALSRGASFCQFVDKTKSAINIISSNLSSLPIKNENYRITFADVFAFLRTYESEIKFELIFSDPPYGQALNSKLLGSNLIFKVARSGTIFVFESSPREILNENERIKLLRAKDYGDTSIYFFKFVE